MAAGRVDRANTGCKFMLYSFSEEPQLTPNKHSGRQDRSMIRFKSLEQRSNRKSVQERVKESQMNQRICVESVHLRIAVSQCNTSEKLRCLRVGSRR